METFEQSDNQINYSSIEQDEIHGDLEEQSNRNKQSLQIHEQYQNDQCKQIIVWCLWTLFVIFFVAGIILISLSYIHDPNHKPNITLEPTTDKPTSDKKPQIQQSNPLKPPQQSKPPQQLKPQVKPQSKPISGTQLQLFQPMETQPRDLIQLTMSETQLSEILNSMRFPKSRPSKFKTKKSTKHIDDIYFAYALSQEPKNQKYLQAQFYYYDKKYNISKYGSQLPMCVVMVGRNIVTNYEKMYESIKQQNYTFYHIIHIDDNSDDGTQEQVKNYLNRPQNRALKGKTVFIEQRQSKYSLENRDIGISQYCSEQEIVLDLDSDDWLIGNQVFQLVNTLFQADPSDLWLLYLNNIIWDPICECPIANSDGQIDPNILNNQKYRTQNIWRTTQLRAFKKKLYTKIDKSDFHDRYGNYHREKSDAFIHFALVQMAAPKHMKIYDQFVYYYETSFAKPSLLRAFSRLASKILTPYEPLDSLSDSPKRKQNYLPPAQLQKQFKQKETEYFKLK